MSPRTFVARSAAILSLAALGLAACESKTVVQPPVQSLSILVSPAAVTLTAAGQKAQFVAVVTGGTSDQVKTYSWTSSNTAVATVDAATGIVTAVANGVSTITATATADATVKSAGLVTVNIPVVVPPVVVPPTISIQSVTKNNGDNVDLQNVSMQINVNLNLDVPPGNAVSSVVTLIDGTTACTQTFTQGGSAQVGVEASNASVITCSINTAQLKADGTPVYPNGPHTISARLVGTTGNILASTSQTFVLNNTNALNLTVTPGKSVTNTSTGQVWAGHGITVKVTPAIFGLTGNITDMTVHVGYASITKTGITSNTAVQTFVFSDSLLNASGLEGLNSIYARSNLSTGFTGPQSPDNPTIQMLIDEVGPAINGTGTSGNGFNLNSPTAPFWLNANSTLSLSSLGFGTGTIVDGGVNTNVVTLSAAANTSGATFAAVASVTDIGQKAAGTEVLKITACDALDNCTSKTSPAFGVDLAPPMIVITAPSAKTNPTPPATVNVIAADTGTVGTTIVSGTPILSLKVKVNIYTATGNFCADSLGTTVTAMPTAGCTAIAAPGAAPGGTNVVLPLAALSQGYDSVVVTAMDSAGNTNTVSSKLYLVDTTPATLGGITFPASVTGGSSVTFSTSAADNVDLGAWTATEAFGAVLALQVGSGSLGTFGRDVFTTAGTPSVVTNPFIISVQLDTAGAVTKATGVGFSVQDVAMNPAATNAFDITATITDPGTFSFRDSAKISGWSMTATTPLSLTGATSLPKVAALKATAIVKTGAAQPFSSVIFYARPVGVGAYVQVATGGAGFATENIINRTYDYSASWTPTVAQTYDVIAVALDAKGHALVSPIVPVVVNP